MTTYQYTRNVLPTWQAVKRPAEIAESRLIEAILDGTFPINAHLPAERDLAEYLGVTRPTLREALQRLSRDGWVDIQHGKPTRVRDYWKEGSLGVLKTLAGYPEHVPSTFITDLLSVRLAIAPAYTALAIQNASGEIIQLLEERNTLNNDPQIFTRFDWQVHHSLAILSENVVFVMILNGFTDLYYQLGPHYFSDLSAQQHSIAFYEKLSQAARKLDINQARILTANVMRESITFWKKVKHT